MPDLRAALDAALAHPVGARPLASVATSRTRVVVIVSDSSRDEPRADLFAAVRGALRAVPDDHLTIAVANGTHGPKPLERLGLPEDVLRHHRVVNHDARDDASMVEMGRTSRGTRVRVNRCVAEADLVVSTEGEAALLRGLGRRGEGDLPGLGHDTDIRQNHKLKADPASSLGRADGNPCREDIEEAVRRLGRDTYLVNVAEAGATIVGAVAGDVVYAHREAVRLARPWCEVEAAPADVVIVSAPLPVSGSLYQASKLIPPAGLLLREGGVVVVAAECPEGTGPRVARGSWSLSSGATCPRARRCCSCPGWTRRPCARRTRRTRRTSRPRSRARDSGIVGRRTRASSCCRTRGISCRG